MPGEDYGYKQFYEGIDTTLMGNETYKAVLGFDVPFPYPDKTNYVFTRSSEARDTEHVRFITGDIVSFLNKIKGDKGKDIWLVGGGQINTILLNHNLIDKIILTLIPIYLGRGIPMFDKKIPETRFDIEESKTYTNGIVQLSMRIK